MELATSLGQEKLGGSAEEPLVLESADGYPSSARKLPSLSCSQDHQRG